MVMWPATVDGVGGAMVVGWRRRPFRYTVVMMRVKPHPFLGQRLMVGEYR